MTGFNHTLYMPAFLGVGRPVSIVTLTIEEQVQQWR
jgi:hypothetical protein